MRAASVFLFAASLAPLAGAGVARAERFAVLPVDAERDGGALPVEAAASVRRALQAQGIDVVGVEDTRAAIVSYLKRGGTDVATYRKQLEQAEAALVALDQVRSLAILERLIGDLAVDPDFSTEKQVLLEGARLKLAGRLVAVAGPKESGEGETEQGRRARATLVDALRANPKLTPSSDAYPPRFFTLMNGARSEVAKEGAGVLSVDSRPQGATVLLEGRDIGKTPLNLGKDVGLVAGKYRMWVEGAGAHSIPQLITIGASPVPVFVDLAFEGALWADGPGIRPLAGNLIDEEVAKKVGRFLGVDTLLLVGKSYDDQQQWVWGAAFQVAEGTTERRGAVHMGGDVTVDNAAVTLAGFLGRGERSGVENRPLPPSVLPERKIALNGTSTGGAGVSVTTTEVTEVPWVPIGATVGAVAALALIGGGAWVLLSSSARNGTVVITVQDLK